jgi:hypothetical protein
MIYRVFAVVLVLPIIAGCFPMRIVKVPGASGRVVESVTSVPIPGASVSIAFSGLHASEARHATTDEEGHFAVPAVRGWIIYIVPMDFMGYFGEATVDASGFKSQSRRLRSSPSGPAIVDCGDIVLEGAMTPNPSLERP